MADWDPSDFHLGVDQIRDVDGTTFSWEGLDIFSVPIEELQSADAALITVIYPDGTSDTRWFAGPWDDYDDAWYDVYDWYENGS